jgi:hypothetical protein
MTSRLPATAGTCAVLDVSIVAIVVIYVFGCSRPSLPNRRALHRGELRVSETSSRDNNARETPEINRSRLDGDELGA